MQEDNKISLWCLKVPVEVRDSLTRALPQFDIKYITIKQPIANFNSRIKASHKPIIAVWEDELSSEVDIFVRSNGYSAASMWLNRTPSHCLSDHVGFSSITFLPIFNLEHWKNGLITQKSESETLILNPIRKKNSTPRVLILESKHQDISIDDSIKYAKNRFKECTIQVFGLINSGNTDDGVIYLDQLTGRVVSEADLVIAGFDFNILIAQSLGADTLSLGNSSINNVTKYFIGDSAEVTYTSLFVNNTVYFDTASGGVITPNDAVKLVNDRINLRRNLIPHLTKHNLLNYNEKDISLFNGKIEGLTSSFAEIGTDKHKEKFQPEVVLKAYQASDAAIRALRAILRKLGIIFTHIEATSPIEAQAYLDMGVVIHRLIIERDLTGDLYPGTASALKLFSSDEDDHSLQSLLSDIDQTYLMHFNNRSLAFKRAVLAPDFKLDLHYFEMALKGGVYSQDILDSGFKLVVDKISSLPKNQVKLFAEKSWRTLGCSVASKRIFDAAKDIRQIFDANFLMFIAAFYTDSGDYSLALKVANQALKLDPDAWRNNRYLGLINLLREDGYLKSEVWAEKDSLAFNHLLKNSGVFRSIIKESGESYAVVGNSPIILGTNSGDIIDSRKTVIRFNSAERSYPFSIDSGEKLDVLVMNPDYSQTRRVLDNSIGHIVISNGDLYYSRDIALKLHDLTDRFTVELIPRHIDLRALKKVEGSPSSGLKLLEWIYSFSGKVPKSNIFGFSLNDQPLGYATSYASDSPKRMPIIHDWEAEAKAFNSIIL